MGEPIRPGTVGRPLWGVDIEVADANVDDRIVPLPAGELGEIVVRGHALFKGYLGNPEASAAAVVDGWFRTGDLGTKDADDIVTIVDRLKDMIVRNGYNVYPSEVEDVMMRHPAVAFAAVFGLPDEARGQEVHAAVVLLDGHDGHARGAGRVRPGAHRGVQVPARGAPGRLPAARGQRQGAQARAGGAVLDGTCRRLTHAGPATRVRDACGPARTPRPALARRR